MVGISKFLDLQFENPKGTSGKVRTQHEKLYFQEFDFIVSHLTWRNTKKGVTTEYHSPSLHFRTFIKIRYETPDFVVENKFLTFNPIEHATYAYRYNYKVKKLLKYAFGMF